MIPTEDELKTLRTYIKTSKGDVDKLGGPERFLLVLADMPMLENWIAAMLFREEFANRHEDLVKKVRIAIAAAAQVHSSEALRDFFALVLSIGNFINEGHMLGNAVGFTFESTNLLSGMKMANKRGTLLHYLVHVLKDKLPKKLDAIWSELPDLKRVMEFSLEFLSSEISDVSTACRGAQKTLSVLEKVTSEVIKHESRTILHPKPSTINHHPSTINNLQSTINFCNHQLLKPSTFETNQLSAVQN